MFGFTEPRTGIEPFLNLITQVMSQEPCAGAKRVFRIVDNRSFHRGQTASGRLTGAFPKAVMVHTPVHASWLNQVGLFFSVVQRSRSRRTISATCRLDRHTTDHQEESSVDFAA